MNVNFTSLSSEFLFECFRESCANSVPHCLSTLPMRTKVTQEIRNKYGKVDLRFLAKTLNLKMEDWISYFKGITIILDRPVLEMGLHLVRHFSQNNALQALQLLQFLVRNPYDPDELFLSFANLTTLAKESPLFVGLEGVELRYSILTSLLKTSPKHRLKEQYEEAVQAWQKLLELPLSDREISQASKYLQDFLEKIFIEKLLKQPCPAFFEKVLALAANRLLKVKITKRSLCKLLQILESTPCIKNLNWDQLYKNAAKYQLEPLFFAF